MNSDYAYASRNRAKKRQIFILIILFAFLIAINYNFLDSRLEGFLIGNDIEYAKVTRVVDGDTIKINGNETVRFLGINTPERGELYYKEAKEFLEKLILNKTVKIERGKEDRDMYERLLRYVFLGDENINLKLVEEGLANPYIYDADKYTKLLRDAWINCIEENKNLCEKSKDECADCIELKELDVKSQALALYNSCGFSCDLNGWTIKDEGRKKFIFKTFILNGNEEVSVIVGNETDTQDILFWKRSDYVWTSGGDTLFLRDGEGKLVLWKNY
ncbi:MAG: thermonuclease family protein [Candidatus Nanoarchaeia archaeon]|nr:thermonuclease family protein [Candidatus Nanoarchaeia archaeon]